MSVAHGRMIDTRVARYLWSRGLIEADSLSSFPPGFTTGTLTQVGRQRLLELIRFSP